LFFGNTAEAFAPHATYAHTTCDISAVNATRRRTLPGTTYAGVNATHRRTTYASGFRVTLIRYTVLPIRGFRIV
jgi:hypothetical protein